MQVVAARIATGGVPTWTEGEEIFELRAGNKVSLALVEGHPHELARGSDVLYASVVRGAHWSIVTVSESLGVKTVVADLPGVDGLAVDDQALFWASSRCIWRRQKGEPPQSLGCPGPVGALRVTRDHLVWLDGHGVSKMSKLGGPVSSVWAPPPFDSYLGTSAGLIAASDGVLVIAGHGWIGKRGL